MPCLGKGADLVDRGESARFMDPNAAGMLHVERYGDSKLLVNQFG